jgi:hypothetical protein
MNADLIVQAKDCYIADRRLDAAVDNDGLPGRDHRQHAGAAERCVQLSPFPLPNRGDSIELCRRELFELAAGVGHACLAS